MYLHKWNEALVDWVNCLALTPKISDISELGSGLFFRLLLKNVIPSDDLSEDELDACDLVSVFAYLSKEFPYYGIEDIISEGESKIVYISSLLLLLSVTKGKATLFYSQLCKDLPHDSQVKIKCFLESCLAAADNLNHSFLKSLVEGDYVPRQEQCVLSPKRVTEVMNTPLKDFLESPRLTDKLSRDLRRLEAEKEALQIEKLEMEDELRTEKEKRERLEENLTKKAEQVVKLREELMEYVQNIDELRKGDALAINPQRIGTLESELKEAESYVKILVEERDLITQEKGRLMEKQSVLLVKMKKLEAQVLNSERTNEELQLTLSAKEQELTEIKTYCCELKERIQLLSTQHNVSLDSDTSVSVINNMLPSPFSGGECLSQAVVDLKLAEVEADNEKLKSLLDATQELSQKLRVQLEEVKDKLEKAKTAQEAAMAENTHIQQQLKTSVEERNELKLTLSEAKNVISSLKETNSCRNEEIADLKNKVTKLEGFHQSLDEKVHVLEDELRIKQEVQEKTLKELDNERLALVNSESKYEQLQYQLDECMKEKKELKASLQKAYESNSSLSDENTMLIKEVSGLKSKLKAVDDSKTCLRKECALLKKGIDEKKEIIEKIEEKVSVNYKENQALKERIVELENINKNLNDVLSQETQKMHESEAYFQKLFLSLVDEMKTLTHFEGTESLVVPLDGSVADKLAQIIIILKKCHISMMSYQENLKSENVSLASNVLLLKESEQNALDKKAYCEKQLSDALLKISSLESHVGLLKTDVQHLTEQLAEKSNHLQQMPLSVKEKEELEALRGDKLSCLNTIAVEEEEINRLNLRISEEEYKIQELMLEKDDLVCQKNNFLSMVGELRTAIDRFSEEKLTSENEHTNVFDLISLCELLKAIVKDFTCKKHFVVASPVMSCNDLMNKSNDNLSEENLNSVKDFHPKFDNLMQRHDITYNVLVKSNNEGKISSGGENVNLSLPLDSEADISRHLGLESKFWQVIRSGEMLEMYREKLEEKNQELIGKLAKLWEVLPKVQLKCNHVFLSNGSSGLIERETELSKELCWQLENMLIRLEKHKASLEEEKMHVSHRAVSWVLNRIQCSFQGSSAYEDANQFEHENKSTPGLLEDMESEVTKSLELIENKFALAVIEADATATIFQEVDRRCSKAEDALEYLKSLGKIETKVLNGATGRNSSMEEDELKVLKAANDEMAKANIHFERICRENHDELQKCHVQIEALHEKVDHLSSQNSCLQNELEIYRSKFVSIREETVEEIKKEYENKLARVRQKLESAYKEDFQKFSQESDKCRQLEESCKKYKNLLMDCHKNLSDLKSYHKGQQQIIETLRKKNALLEEKLFESQLNFGVVDVSQSMNSDLNRSHSAEHLATYFARGDVGGLESVKFSSENRLYPLNSSNFSRESGRSNLPSGMGQVFCTEDEEGESFNATFLSDLKEGRCDVPNSSVAPGRKTLAVLQEQNRQTNAEDHGSQPITDTPTRRLNELMRRNTLCLPHLKSSYPAETQIQDPRNFTEDCLKGNSSLKAPLLSGNQPRRLSGNICGDLRRRKDKGQIAYMKPGPPTPGKNRRSSLQGNENVTEPKIQSTPGRILSWFGRRRRSVWDAENIPDTPRTKQKGLSRRPGFKQSHDDS